LHAKKPVFYYINKISHEISPRALTRDSLFCAAFPDYLNSDIVVELELAGIQMYKDYYDYY
jgi:hypothetical protein